MNYDDLETAHLDLSPTDWDLRQFARENPEYQRRANFPLLAHPAKLHAYPLQMWPTFVKRHKIDELKSLSIAVSQLIRSIPERIFRNDPAALSRYFGLSHLALTKVMLSPPNGLAEAFSRGDFVLTAQGFKCIEFNLVANLGGWETALIAAMHLKTPLTAQFFAEKGIAVRFTDTLDVMLQHILADARSLFPDRGQPFNIAIGFGTNYPSELLAALTPVFQPVYRQACAAQGVAAESQVLTCHPEQLTLDSDANLKLGAQRIHAVVTFYPTNPPAIFRSFKSQKVKLYNSPLPTLLSDKRMLAMLSLSASTDLVSAEERQWIEKAIPWTRTNDVPPILQAAGAALSVDEVVARREELVLKSANSFGGKDVYIGQFTPHEEWSVVVRQAFNSPNWVVQEYLQSVPLLYQNGEVGCSPHNVIWGPFVFGTTYGGMILRMQPQADKTPVNLSLTATEGMVFEVD